MSTAFSRALTGAGVRCDNCLRGAGLLSPSNLILTYHAVGDPRKYGSVPVDRLHRDLAYLTGRFDVVDLADLVDAVRNGTPGRRVALTFDDGYRDFYTNALPVLHRYDAPATVFVCPAFVDDGNPDLLRRLFTSPDSPAVQGHDGPTTVLPDSGDPLMLTERQLRALVDDDLVAIGNHTMTHPDLRGISDEADLRREIVGGKEALETRFDVAIDRFSYPYGRFTESSVRIAESSHDLAVTTLPGRVSTEENPYRLPRVTAHTNPGQFRWNLADSRWTIADVRSRIVDVTARTAARFGLGPRSG